MKTLQTCVRAALVLAACAGAAYGATATSPQAIVPPSDYKNLRLGLWEMTNETSMQGGPRMDMAQMQARMAESMKDMTPEQRARIDALMKRQAQSAGEPRTSTRQKCFTAADRDKASLEDMQDRSRSNCTMKEITRTSSKLVFAISCSARDMGPAARAEGSGDGPMVMEQNGTVSFEMMSPTQMESRIQFSGMMGKAPMKSDIQMHAHWISADCGKVKQLP